MEGHCLTGQSPQWAVMPMGGGGGGGGDSCLKLAAVVSLATPVVLLT